MKRILAILIFLGIVMSLTSCGAPSKERFDIDMIKSYRDIPNVSEEEIAAIDRIKSQKESLTYGHLTETEAFILPDGTYAGFTTKFCALLSDLFGIQFKQQFCDWEELKSKLDNRSIDFTGEMTPTAERLQSYYMTHTIADRPLKIFYHMDSPDIAIESDLNGLNVGFLKDTIDAELVHNVYPELRYHMIECASFFDASQKLKSHEIDVFVSEGIVDPAFDEFSFIRSKAFFPLAYIPVSLTSANAELAPFISVVNKYLVAGGIDKLFELYQEGDEEYAKFKLHKTFAPEERAYIHDMIAQGVKIAVAFEHDNYPISFYNKSEKEFQGISVDVLKEVSHLTGLQFEAATNENTKWAEMLADLRSGKIPMASQLLYSQARKDDFLWTDVPYCSTYYALLSKSDYDNLSSHQVLRASVGTILQTGYEDMYNEWFPNNTNTVGYNSQDEALEALENGAIDLIMASEYTLLTQTNYREKPGFKVNIRFNDAMDSRFGFHKNESLLCSIINKTQPFIKTATITEDWTSRVFDYSKKLAEERLYYLLIFVAILVFVLIVIVRLLMKDKRLSKSLETTVKERTHALERQTATLSTIFASIPDLVFCKDVNGVFMNCNPSFAKFAGVPMAEIIGKNDHDVFGIDETMVAGFLEADKEILRSLKTKVIEEVITYPDGTKYTVETAKMPLLSGTDQSVVGILGISRDVTNRKKTAETLRITLDNLNTLIYINEIDTGKILFMNKKMKAEFGGDDFEGQVCWKVLQDGFTEQCEFCPMPKILASGDDYYTWEEHNTVTKKYYKNTDSLITWSDGQLVHMQHSLDITDERQAEVALRRRLAQQELMSAISQSFITNDDMDIFINKTLQMTGEFMNVSSIVLAQYIEAERALELKYAWFNNANETHVEPGSKLPFDHGTPMHDAFLVQNRAVVCVDDVVGSEAFQHIKRMNIKSFLAIPVFVSGTLWGVLEFDQCAHAYAWSESDHHLGKLISNVLSGIINRHIMEQDKKSAAAALLRAKEMAEQASSAKGDFLSRMSHEIRTPMNAIMGMTKIAEGSSDIQKMRCCLSTISSSSQHLLGIINDILDMSKIEAGKFELDNEWFNIEKMLMKICNLMIDKTEQRKQALSIKISKRMHLNYLGDELRLSQVITNLLANAVKFTPEGGKITLAVDEVETMGDDMTLRFSISDTGIGMTSDQIKRLFNSFEQADGSISRRYGGTGLGLAISKNIIEKMGGSVWVESELGKGATFTFDVKLTCSSQYKSGIIFDGILASDLKLLIVDDSSDVRAQFLEIVHNFGIYSDEAEGGEKAISLIGAAFASNKPYDVVFLDSDMPDMDGLETIKRLSGKIDKNTVIILMSFSEGDALEDAARRMGVNRFMNKLLFPSSILNAINEVIGHTIKTLDIQTAAPQETIDFSSVSLLLVEDVAINREIFIALMEGTQVRIDVAENGLIAVQKFKDNPTKYDMIIMDIQMPEMDGYEATKTIRALDIPNAKTIPIIAMTANAFREDIDKCMACGMNDHVSKPIDVNTVMEKISQYSQR